MGMLTAKAALLVSAVLCLGISGALLIGDYYLYVHCSIKSNLSKSANIIAAAGAVFAAISCYLK